MASAASAVVATAAVVIADGNEARRSRSVPLSARASLGPSADTVVAIILRIVGTGTIGDTGMIGGTEDDEMQGMAQVAES